jgi:hypothetical protein
MFWQHFPQDRQERKRQDYNVVLYTVVSSTWSAAAGCLCREHLGEREHFTPILFTVQKTYEGKYPKMAKIPL